MKITQWTMPVIKAALVTLSDKGSRGERVDESGPLLAQMLESIHAEIVSQHILPDDEEAITAKLIELSGTVDLILTTGGTGLSPRDVTPEATRRIIDREIPGIPELMRAEGLKITKRSALSRAVAGVRGGCLIINLPGSPKAVSENLSVILDILPHAIEKIQGGEGDCAR